MHLSFSVSLFSYPAKRKRTVQRLHLVHLAMERIVKSSLESTRPTYMVQEVTREESEELSQTKAHSPSTTYKLKLTTNDAARTIDVSPNSLKSGQSGSFDTGYMLSRNSSFPTLTATGSK